MAEGGSCAYSAPISEAQAAFGVDGFAQMFRQLGQEHADERPVAVSLSGLRVERRRVPEPPGATGLATNPHPHESLRPGCGLGSVAAASAAPPALLLGALGLVVGTSQGLGGSSNPYTPGIPVNPGASVMLLILVLGATFMGLTSAIQEMVKERVIYERERFVGLPTSASFAPSSCFCVWCRCTRPACSSPSRWSADRWGTTLVHPIADDDDDDDDDASGARRQRGEDGGRRARARADGRARARPGARGGRRRTAAASASAQRARGKDADVLLPCLVLGLASVALGLMASALIRSADQAMPILVLAAIILIVLSGAITLRFEGILRSARYACPASGRTTRSPPQSTSTSSTDGIPRNCGSTQ